MHNRKPNQKFVKEAISFKKIKPKYRDFDDDSWYIIVYKIIFKHKLKQ